MAEGGGGGEGRYIWIAEADDESEPRFVERLLEKIGGTPDVCLAFSDSRPIDQDGKTLNESYKFYYAETDPTCLAQDEIFTTQESGRRLLSERNLILNVSAVIWKRTALLAALRASEDALARYYRVAGDWHLYIEVMASNECTWPTWPNR